MKKVNKILCGILGASFLLAGCATVGNIQNDQTEVIYNGNSAVMVSDNLYFGNSIADIGSGFSYKDAKTYAYLSRLNTKLDFGAKDQDYSPKTVEMVEGEVVGHENSFMFALGDYVYYAVPNQKEFKNDEGKPEKHYDYTTIMRCKLNGDKNKELYTAEGTVSQIEVLKYGENYYIVFLAQTLSRLKLEIQDALQTMQSFWLIMLQALQFQKHIKKTKTEVLLTGMDISITQLTKKMKTTLMLRAQLLKK